MKTLKLALLRKIAADSTAADSTASNNKGDALDIQ
jgi:hypothetical protein